MGLHRKEFISPQSGRMIVAQQFTAGVNSSRDLQSVKRTAESLRSDFSAVRFTDFLWALANPSDESLGYYHSSALRTDKTTFCAKQS